MSDLPKCHDCGCLLVSSKDPLAQPCNQPFDEMGHRIPKLSTTGVPKSWCRKFRVPLTDHIPDSPPLPTLPPQVKATEVVDGLIHNFLGRDGGFQGGTEGGLPPEISLDKEKNSPTGVNTEQV